MSALGDGYPFGQNGYPDQKAQESAVGGTQTSPELYSMWFESSVCSCVSLCMRQGETRVPGSQEPAGLHWELRD